MSTTAAGRPIRPAPPRRVAEALPPALALDRYTVRQQLLTVTAQRYDILDDSGAPPSFLSTHPSSDARAAAIRERTRSLTGPKPEPLAIDWKAVQASVK